MYRRPPRTPSHWPPLIHGLFSTGCRCHLLGQVFLKREMWLLCDVELFLEVTFQEIPFLCYHSTGYTTPTQIPPISNGKGVLFKSSVTSWTLNVLWFTFTAASVRYFAEMLFNVGPMCSIWKLIFGRSL